MKKGKKKSKNSNVYLWLALVITLVSILCFDNFIAMFLLAEKSGSVSSFLGINTITCVFVHGDFGHLKGNMIAYFLFAPQIEKKVGGMNFLVLFFLGNILGSLLTYKFSLSGASYSLGASASISALMMYHCIVFWDKKIKLFNRFRVHGMFLLFLSIPLIIGDFKARNGGGNVGHWAHIGGYLAGIVYYFALGTSKKALFKSENIKRSVGTYLLLAFVPYLYFLKKKKYGVAAGITAICIFVGLYQGSLAALIYYLFTPRKLVPKAKEDKLLDDDQAIDKVAA